MANFVEGFAFAGCNSRL